MGRKRHPDSTTCPDCKLCPSCGLMAHDDKITSHSSVCMRKSTDKQMVGFITVIPDYPDVAFMVKRLNGDIYLAGHVLPSYMRGKRVLVSVALLEEEDS